MSAAGSVILSDRWARELRHLFAGPRQNRSPRDSFAEIVPALLVFALTTLRAQAFIYDGNTYIHIAAGQWMLTHHAILHSDPFSYTFAGRPWFTHEWLAEIIMAVVFGLGSWQALDLLFGFAAAASTFLLTRTLLRYLNPVPAIVVQQLALFGILFVFQLTPNPLILPILILWTDGLLTARDEKRGPHLAMLPLMLLWANMHGSFVVGLFLVAVFGLEAAFESGKSWPQALRPWLLFGAGASIAAALTPHGVEGLIFPVRLLSASALLGLVFEFQSSSFSTITPLELFLLATMFFFMVSPARVPVIRLCLFLLLVHLTLAHRREIDVLATVGSMILARPIADALNPGAEPAARSKTLRYSPFVTACTVLCVILVATIRLVIPAVPKDSRAVPAAAISHVPTELAQRPVFNSDFMGGYLISRGIRPFIDGRLDMYGYDFAENYARIVKADRGAIENTFSKYNIAWTILSPDNLANQILDLLPGWHVLYKDTFAVVHVRSDSRSLTSVGAHGAAR